MKNPRMPLGVAMPLPAIRSTSAPWTTRMIGQATTQTIAAPETVPIGILPLASRIS